MNSKLKYQIEKVIQQVLDKNCEDPLWEGYIHSELVSQMTVAAESVFDAAMKAQIFAEENA